VFQFLYHAENIAEKLHEPKIRLYHGYSKTGIFFLPKMLYHNFSMEESIVMMKNPLVMARSLVFFNECGIIHAPLLDCAGLIVLEECVYNGLFLLYQNSTAARL
jgi:hypothetical protein